MRRTARLLPLCLVALTALLVTGAPAAAAPKRITGKLSRPGYDVIALAADGDARLVAVKRRKFRIRPPASRVTLHLRRPNGRDAGPVVVAREKKGRRAILGVRAGARLGKIKIRRGWAKVSHRVPDNSIDSSRRAHARDGVPLGAGNFGFVRSKVRASSPPADRDADGIPDALDIAADGDLLLNRFENSKEARAAQGSTCCPNILSALDLQLEQTVNANAATLSVGDINDAARQYGHLQIGIRPSDPGKPPELDCGGPSGLSYCSPGGTGTVEGGGELDGDAFPDCCDDDMDGLGTLWDGINNFLQHGATVAPEGGRDAEIKAADPIYERVTTGGVEQAIPSGMELILATVPALVGYSDTAGNCAKVAGMPGSCATTFTYPVPAGGPGTGSNGFLIAPGGGGIELTVTFWRPQRLPIPSTTEVGGDPCLQESPPCEWVDIGNLAYTVVLNNISGPQVNNLVTCPQSAYTPAGDLGEPTSPLVGYSGAVIDTIGDRATSPANTFTYSLDVTACLASHGDSLEPGEALQVQFVGTNEFDHARQFVTFRRP